MENKIKVRIIDEDQNIYEFYMSEDSFKAIDWFHNNFYDDDLIIEIIDNKSTPILDF